MMRNKVRRLGVHHVLIGKLGMRLLLIYGLTVDKLHLEAIEHGRPLCSIFILEHYHLVKHMLRLELT